MRRRLKDRTCFLTKPLLKKNSMQSDYKSNQMLVEKQFEKQVKFLLFDSFRKFYKERKNDHY